MLSFPSAINQGGINNIVYNDDGSRVKGDITEMSNKVSSFDVSRIKAMNVNLNSTMKQEFLSDNNLDISVNNYRLKSLKFVNSGATQLQGQGNINDNEFATTVENPYQTPASITANYYKKIMKIPANVLMSAGSESGEAPDTSSTDSSSNEENTNQENNEQSTQETPKKRTIPEAVEITGGKVKVASSIFSPIHTVPAIGPLENTPLLNIKTEGGQQLINIDNSANGTMSDTMSLIMNSYTSTESINTVNANGTTINNGADKNIASFYESFMAQGKDDSGLIVDNGTMKLRVNWNPFNTKMIEDSANCTIRELVNKSHTPNGVLGMAKYRYVDFLFCKHIGKVSNNHLITLRRFAHPVGDNIFRFSGKGYLNERMPGYHGFQENGSIGTLITWFGTDDNKLEDILSYSVKSSWQEFHADIQEIDSQEDQSPNGIIGMFANSFNPAYNSLVARGMAGSNSLWDKTGTGIFGATLGKIPGLGNKDAGPDNAHGMKQWDLMRMSADKNKIYTPQNTIQATHKYKGELTLSHEFTLNFSYRLRALDLMNPKAVMLDLIGNILEVTYNRGHFWGGERRLIGPPRNASGVAKANAFIDRQWDKLEGFMMGFANGTIEWGSILSSLSDMVSSAVSTVKSMAEGGVKEMFNSFSSGAKKLAGKFVSSGASRAILGRLKNSLGRPAVYCMDSLLDGSPVGLWHVTIGNPKNPIAAFGNLILTDTKITHSGPLGFDDFPTEIKVSCTLKHGRSRDLTEVARMYTKGTSGIYISLDKNKLSEFFTVSNTDTGRQVETEMDTANYVKGAQERKDIIQNELTNIESQIKALQTKKNNAQNKKNEAAKANAEQQKQESKDNSDKDKKDEKTATTPTTQSTTTNSSTSSSAEDADKEIKSIDEQISKLEQRKTDLENTQAADNKLLNNDKYNKYLDNYSLIYGDMDSFKKSLENKTSDTIKKLYTDYTLENADDNNDNMLYGHFIRDEWALRYETLGQDLDTEGRILIDENA